MGEQATIRAVCVSERKGEQKHPVDRIDLRPHHGIVGDAHAGDCVMPREGIFAVVLEAGEARIGDMVQVMDD